MKIIHNIEELGKIGAPSYFTCPDCHGTLWEIDNDKILHYRRRVGHVFGAADLAASLSENVENALWAAMRTLEESANIAKRLADNNHQGKGSAHIARRFKESEIENRKHANMIKKILLAKNS